MAESIVSETRKTITVNAESYNHATLLLSEVEALLDLMGEAAPNVDSLNPQTLQSSCILAGKLVAEAQQRLLDGESHARRTLRHPRP